MEKYITNIKDLVIQVLTNGSEIKSKAEKHDALSCFQMGMIYLLGINTQIDFKKAGSFFGNQSLSDDPYAKLLLGFIAECEGDFSESFKRYTEATQGTNDGKADHYILNIIKERNILKKLLDKLDLPCNAFNKEISKILDDYVRGGDLRINACISLATICNDESTFLVVAESFYAIGDYYSAKKWLKRGNIDSSNHLYIFVKERLCEIESTIKSSSRIEIIEINGNSILENLHSPSYANINGISSSSIESSRQEWQDNVSIVVDNIKKYWEEEERIRLQKIKEEEAERQKKLQEEEERQRILQEEAEHQMKLKEEAVHTNKSCKIMNINQQIADGKILETWVDNNGNFAASSFDGEFQMSWDRENSVINELYTNNFVSTIRIIIHCHILINELKDKSCKIAVNLKPSIGTGNDINGLVSLTPVYDNCEWKDFQINIACFKFGLKKDGRYYYDVSLSLYDSFNELLDTSSFQMTIDYTHHMFKDDEIIVVQ